MLRVDSDGALICLVSAIGRGAALGLLVAGIGIAIHGLTVRKITLYSRGWPQAEEKEWFEPKWYHRAIIVFVGAFMACAAAISLMGAH
jgi:hypothetical protein